MDRIAVDNAEVTGVWSNEGYPSFTEDLLRQACSATVTFLLVVAEPLLMAMNAPDEWAEILAGQKPYFGQDWDFETPQFGGNCDHAVFLESCDFDDNSYSIWTWGGMVKVTREVLLGVPVQPPHLASRTNTTFNTGIICSGISAQHITT